MVEGRYTSKPVTLMESLIALDPSNPEYLRLLGRSFDIGALQDLRSELYPRSRAYLNKAVATLIRAREVAPDDDTAARWLALAYTDLDLLDQKTGQNAERIPVLGRALTIFEALERKFPISRRHKLDRAQCLVQLGMARIDLGQFAQAALSLHDAHDRLGRLSDENPDVVDVRHWLAVSKRGLGEVAVAQGRIAASPWLQQAIELQKRAPAGSLSSRDLIELAWSYSWLGRAEIQAGRPEALPPLRVQLATIFAAIKDRGVTWDSPWPSQSRETRGD